MDAGLARCCSCPHSTGPVLTDLAEPVARNQVELETLGWEVRVLDGLDHMQAMLPDNALPILRPWLQARFAAHVDADE